MGKHTGTKTGRSESLLLRVPAPTKEALRIAAEETGRTMTGEAQHRIERSLEMDKGKGGAQIAALLDYLGATAQLIQSRPFDEEKADWQRHQAIKTAFEAAIEEFLPPPRTIPGYIDEFIELAEREPKLWEAAKSRRTDLGAEEEKEFIPRGIFGGGAAAAEAAQRQKGIRAVDPYRFRPEPPTNPVENLDEALDVTSENANRIGLFGDLSAFVATRPKAVRIETNEQGEPTVRNGALDALMQEQELRYRENIKISKPEFEWAEARDRITILLVQLDTDEGEAKAAGRLTLMKVRARHKPHDMLAEYESIGQALREAGVTTS